MIPTFTTSETLLVNAMLTAAKNGRVSLQCTDVKAATALRMRTYNILKKLRQKAKDDLDVQEFIAPMEEVQLTLEDSCLVFSRKDSDPVMNALKDAIIAAGGEILDLNEQMTKVSEQRLKRLVSGATGGVTMAAAEGPLADEPQLTPSGHLKNPYYER